MTVIMDVYSRKIVVWGIRNSMSSQWYLNVLHGAIAEYGKPEIFISDQGSRYNSALWTQHFEQQCIQISMDGKDRALDNVWIERFWKSLKYDRVYLNPADDGFKLYEGLQYHIGYDHEKIHHTTRPLPNNRFEQPLKNAA